MKENIFGKMLNLHLSICLFCQLDPQMLQGKDWQRTVIPMNGVSVIFYTHPLPYKSKIKLLS